MRLVSSSDDEHWARAAIQPSRFGSNFRNVRDWWFGVRQLSGRRVAKAAFSKGSRLEKLCSRLLTDWCDIFPHARSNVLLLAVLQMGMAHAVGEVEHHAAQHVPEEKHEHAPRHCRDEVAA